METVNNNIVNEEPKPGTKAFLEAELEAAKAELEALKAQAEKDAAAKAETVAPVEERVDLFVPKGYANDEPNLMISVNGVNYVLPRGKTSNVPKHIAEEFYRSQKAQEALDKHVDEMLGASK